MAKPRRNQDYLSKTKEMKKRRRKYPNVFFKKEIVTLFDNMDDVKIMVASFLTFFCALRISETSGLKWKDIDLVNGRVKVVDGKGGKDGFIKMSRDCTQVIKRWRKMNPNEEYLLPSDLPGYPHLHSRIVLKRFRGFYTRKNGKKIVSFYNAEIKKKKDVPYYFRERLRMREKMNTPEGKKTYSLRKITVEPSFGNIKQNLGFREFLLRGLEKVKIEINLVSIAHNLQKIYSMKRENQVMRRENSQQHCFEIFFLN